VKKIKGAIPQKVIHLREVSRVTMCLGDWVRLIGDERALEDSPRYMVWNTDFEVESDGPRAP
jgi:hypothetical protein